jgi:hypothetical protein
MNDFLQTLRSNQSEKQRTPMTRRSYDEAFYNASPRYQYANRTAAPFQPPNQLQEPEEESSRLLNALENLNGHMAALAQSQKHLIDAQEKNAEMIERQVIAIERILEHLQIGSN